ncbi:MAG: tetratricopeptide repeat protein [Gloeomargaritaceae cyanobacterium C42_A2020_066]|nr:tetratricopeptide repeat protein [Gloeomargaritaceae cyanobacterium C42_A2020_066]
MIHPPTLSPARLWLGLATVNTIGLTLALVTQSPFSLAALYRHQGIVRSNQGDYALALESFQRLVSLQPEDPESFLLRGIAQARAGAYQEALDDFETASQLSPGRPEPWVARGNTLILIEGYRQAINAYSRALKLDPEALEAYSGRSVAYENLGQRKEALADLQTLQERLVKQGQLAQAEVVQKRRETLRRAPPTKPKPPLTF